MLHGPCPQAKGVYTVAAETLPCRCHVCRCGGCLCVWLAQCGDGKWPSHSGTCTRLYQYSTLCYSPLVFQARSPSFLQSLSLDWCLSKKRGPSGAAQSLAAAHERWICQQSVEMLISKIGFNHQNERWISDVKWLYRLSIVRQ